LDGNFPPPPPLHEPSRTVSTAWSFHEQHHSHFFSAEGATRNSSYPMFPYSQCSLKPPNLLPWCFGLSRNSKVSVCGGPSFSTSFRFFLEITPPHPFPLSCTVGRLRPWSHVKLNAFYICFLAHPSLATISLSVKFPLIPFPLL